MNTSQRLLATCSRIHRDDLHRSVLLLGEPQLAVADHGSLIIAEQAAGGLLRDRLLDVSIKDRVVLGEKFGFGLDAGFAAAVNYQQGIRNHRGDFGFVAFVHGSLQLGQKSSRHSGDIRALVVDRAPWTALRVRSVLCLDGQ